MIDAFIRSMIGSWGNAILDFYITNSLWINALLLFYALLVVLSRHNFDNSLQLLIILLQGKYGEQISKKSSSSLLKMLKKADIPWENSLSKSMLPFITPPGSLWLYPKNPKNFQKLVTTEKLATFLKQNSTG